METKKDGAVTTTITKPNGASSTTQVDEAGKTETNGEAALRRGHRRPGERRSRGSAHARRLRNRRPGVCPPPSPLICPPALPPGWRSPWKNVTAGTVAVLVKSDGTEEILKTSLTTENGISVTLSDGDTVKIVDNTKNFTDVPDTYWGADAVAFAASREIFSGTSETTFAPAAFMTRAMIVTVLARLENVDTSTGDTWYEAGREWAMGNGISDGSNMGAPLTREQLATMLYRYAQFKGYDTAQGGMAIREYADFEQISDYAVEAMTWAVNTGLLNGVGNNTLAPQSLATRAQVATILLRFIRNTAQ